MDRRGQPLQENMKAMRYNHKAVVEGDRAAQSTCTCQGGKAIQLKRAEQSFSDSAIDYKTEFRATAHR